jgi:hypothetical protein
VRFYPEPDHRRAEVVEFEAAGLPMEQLQAQLYLRIRAGAKGGGKRFIPRDAGADGGAGAWSADRR